MHTSASSVRKEVVLLLYYIVSLLISVGVDAVLYCLYKWLDKKWK